MSRLGRERSEDAVTYNVFRPLERLGLLDEYLSQVTGMAREQLRLIYWSYSPWDGGAWPCLDQARAVFGEEEGRGSEPDLVAVGEKTLYFIEVKLTAWNRTTPSDGFVRSSYTNNADAWFDRVFTASAHEIAIRARKYELMRFWLLGSWIAQRTGRSFALVSLNPASHKENLADDLGRYLIQDNRRQFSATTWEDLAKWIRAHGDVDDELLRIHGYLCDKTAGYDGLGNLQRALQLHS
jgi:hypothetical protein